MERQEQIDFGERLLVAGVFSVLIVEALFTILSASEWISLSRLLLSVVGGVLILFLGGWLYTGSRKAWQVAVAWLCLELLLTLIPLVVLLVSPAEASVVLLVSPAEASPANAVLALGVPVAWLMCLKFLVYLSFLLLLVTSVSVRAFLDSRHGEPSATPVSLAGAAAPAVTLTEPQVSLFQALATTFQAVGLLVLLAGAGLMVWETTTAPFQRGPNSMVLLEGLVLLILGLVLLLPPGALNLATQSEAGHSSFDQVFRRLGWLCVGVLVGGLIFLAVALVHLRPLYS